MSYRFGYHALSALVMLGLGFPVFAQDATTQPRSAPPVLVPEQTTGPAKVAPPPIAPTLDAETDAAPAPAPKAVKKGPVDSLKPGQFVWEKRDVYEGPLKIVAVLDIQRMYVFQNDQLIGFSTISAGKKGKETPTGYFNILQKNIDHKSNIYSNAPMPYMQRLTWDGIALHGGHIPGYPASHGCIRLPHAFAKALFGVTDMDQEVVVLQNTSTPLKRPEPKPVPVVEPPIVPAEPVLAPTMPEQPAVTPPASPPKPTIVPQI